MEFKKHLHKKGGLMMNCPSCGLDVNPQYDTLKKEYFCPNCLDTLHISRSKTQR